MTTEPVLLDARDQKCPLPVLRLEKRLASSPAGTRILVLATDPMARIDIPLFCRHNGHGCETSEVDGVYRFAILRGA